ncbi:MAG: glycosyltransferase family 4 protein [Candidatus Hydrogenedentes bacterium]|nr:glycosyltransferase family 4 protein [Candidatus Hydrogenedentota bacterium]
MKVVHIIPGSGGTFYCQNCIRDVALVRAMRKQGHDVMVVPMYLPFGADSRGISEHVPVFFGGINVYLQQKFKLFRKTPHWLDRILDARWFLRQAAKREGTTEAAGLGPMTLSMLHGVKGYQEKEVVRLVAWLREQEKPDAVHLSNSLLLGLAGELKRALSVPVICTLQDEESWLDHIEPPYDRLCWEAMSASAEVVDAFIVVSRWYASEMAKRMPLAPEKIRVVPLGIDLEGREAAPHPPEPPVLGYLSKMTPSLGLGVLVDAFIALKNNPALRTLKFRATGGALGADVHYVAELKAKLDTHGMAGDAEFLDSFDAAQRREFLRSLSVLSVPALQGEAFGMFVLEAMAAGVPAVQPNIGAFPEVIEATGGGVVYDATKKDALVSTLEALLLDPAHAQDLGRRGREAVFSRYGIDRMAADIVNVYQSLMT